LHDAKFINRGLTYEAAKLLCMVSQVCIQSSFELFKQVVAVQVRKRICFETFAEDGKCWG